MPPLPTLRAPSRATTRRGLASAPAACLAGLALALVAPVAEAEPMDGQAEKALKAAMEVDYLETRFDNAEGRLLTAITRCGEDGCSKAISVRLQVALATVLAGGLNRLDDAKDAFVTALMIDLTAKPDPALVTTAIAFAFEQARADLNVGNGTGERVRPTLITEQEVSRPVPVYVELAADLWNASAKISVIYQAPGDEDWTTLVLKKIRERGFGIELPCAAVEKAGTIRYYFTVTGLDGEVLASSGSTSEPHETELKSKVDGELPHWPGYASPGVCGKGAGVEAAAQCIDDGECNAGLLCLGGLCVPPREEPPEKSQKNWVSASFIADASIVSGSDVCSVAGQNDNNFVCLRSDRSRYQGTPTLGQANNVNTGVGLSTMRVVLGYDRLLVDSVTLGGRVGFAFNGASDGGAAFVPVHLELRGAYWFGKAPFEEEGTRPFVSLSAGFAQIDTEVEVKVLEDGSACGAADPASTTSPCTRPSGGDRVEERQQTLAAYKQAGLGFFGLGVGMQYAPMKNLALSLAVRGSVTLPVVTAVISPEAGVAFGF